MRCGDDVVRPVDAAVDLYWIPLGAGAYVVRTSGKVAEAVVARVQRRQPDRLYHSALEVRVPEGRFVVEQAPVPDRDGVRRGVVASGPVGVRWAGRARIFRYEVRCWRDGSIPDLAHAVGGPVRLSDDTAVASRVLAELPHIPVPVWGRDELDTGEMWNSNSIVAWALERGGVDLSDVRPPPGGRAPGWGAGLTVARRAATDARARR